MIWPSFTQNKESVQKRHYFQYKEDNMKAILNKEKQKDEKQIVNEELKFLSRYGFTKKALDSIPNNTLMNLDVGKTGFSTSLRLITHKTAKTEPFSKSHVDSMWQKNQQDKINSIKAEHENIRRDVDYVRTLSNWDKNFLPKLK